MYAYACLDFAIQTHTLYEYLRPVGIANMHIADTHAVYNIILYLHVIKIPAVYSSETDILIDFTLFFLHTLIVMRGV